MGEGRGEGEVGKGKGKIGDRFQEVRDLLQEKVALF